MCEANLKQVPEVDIDPSGKFKYILVKIYGQDSKDSPELSKTVVRGYKDCGYHCEYYIINFNLIVVMYGG